jgi:hypothetical protein
MAADFDINSVDVSEVFEGVAAVLLAPVMLPLASAVNQPLVKSALREGIAFSERCQEAIADAQERLEDTLAEAQAEVDRDRRNPHHGNGNGGTQDSLVSQTTPMSDRPSYQRTAGQFSNHSTQTASQVQDTIQELNSQIRWLTNDLLDLRLLVTLGLGTFAIRQILVRGLRLDEIPWYAVAWYALDTFIKFHPDSAAEAAQTDMPTTIEVESAPKTA